MAKKENSSIFPNNVVDRILRSLTAEEDLLVCRKVDPTWISIVNQLPPLHSWNPWLARADNDALITFLATIFLFKSDIEKFLSSHQQYDPKNNPFLNRTVVLGFRKGAWDSFTEYFAFQLIANKFGAHLQKFVYRPDVDEDLSESPWRHLPQMLTSMPNLRSLVLEHRNKITTYVKWKSIPVPDFPHKLEQLQELLIKASYQYQSNIRLCEKLAVNHGSQIRSLELSPFVLDNEKRNLLNLFPNLKEFKSLDFEVLKSANLTACNWPKLEGLALLVYTLEDSRAFRDTLNFIKNFAQTLKVLSLGLEELDESEEIEPPEWETVSFPNLVQLAVPIYLFNHRLPIESRFRFTFPNLQRIILQDRSGPDGFSNRKISEREMKKICDPVWPLLPKSVDTIYVRTEKYNLSVFKKHAVMFGCKRS